ncbi:MAG: Do family serine endopeptidase [Chitinivibrionales bacterium]|nr:Do family serine endopeptidase [Chitinivibrionales bacterium]MBD3394684.1 Do family serine endopeptidase [Chitinivibrionales bacterium]
MFRLFQEARMKATRSIMTGVAILLASALVFNCKFSFADDKRPKEGSVEFGAASRPDIQTSPQFEAFKTVFSNIAEAVIPTVVSVTSTKIDTVVYRDPFSQFFWGSPFDDWFGRPGPQQKPAPERQERRRTTGFGSGVIVSKDGYILTNYHVVGDADEIVVETADEREFEAEIVGVDSLSDVAVIRITKGARDLPVAFLGNSNDLKPGDWVMAVGNPFNLSSTVTTGIVSAVGRYTGGITTYQNFIQTDAAINPGNSGGALVNVEGELVGINTMIYSRTGGYMGIGFAIPINMAKTIMEQLIYHGEVRRGWLGVQISDIDQSMKEALGLKSKKGVLINDVFEGQPADKAGIESGDVVLSIDGIRTGNANELKNTVASIAPGKKVPVEIVRDGKKKTLHVTLARRDEEKISAMRTGSEEDTPEAEEPAADADIAEKLGFTAGELTAELRERLDLDRGTKGVVVLEIGPASRAARKGVRKFDIIHKIKVKGEGVVKVTGLKSFRKALAGVKTGTPIMLYLEREGNSFFVAFKTE